MRTNINSIAMKAIIVRSDHVTVLTIGFEFLFIYLFLLLLLFMGPFASEN